MLFLPITLNCPPVQSFHNSTANFRVHACVTFLVNGDKRPLLMGCFLKHLEMSPFFWRWFCRCAINRLSHAFPWTWNIFTNAALIPKICWLAASWVQCSLPKTSEKLFFLLHVFHVCMSTSKSKSAYFCLSHICTMSKSGFGKFQHKSFGYSLEKSERLCLFVVVFSWMRKSRTFERLSIFLECPIDFDDFPEQILYSCNGRHVWQTLFFMSVKNRS